MIGSIYPSLDIVDPTGKANPYLADSWTTSPDKLTWTFKIHSGLKWSDGQPITAKDAAWTFNLIMTNKIAAHRERLAGRELQVGDRPERHDARHHDEEAAGQHALLSVPITGIPIVPQHIWKSKVTSRSFRDFKNTDFPVVGYGPWTLTGYQTDQFTELTANKSFFLGAPKFDKLDAALLQQTRTPRVAGRRRTASSTRRAASPPPQYQAAEDDKPGITGYQQRRDALDRHRAQPAARATRPASARDQHGNPALADPKVRRRDRLRHRPRRRCVKKILTASARPAARYIPPAYPQWAWTPTAAQPISYNPARPTRCSTAAGYTKGSDGDPDRSQDRQAAVVPARHPLRRQPRRADRATTCRAG